MTVGNSYHSPWDAAVPKCCGSVVIRKPVCFSICVFLPSLTIAALCVSLEGAVSAVTGAHEGQHPACLHPFGAWSSREMPCPRFHPPTSSTGQLCAVCVAQKCVLQALTVEGRNEWIWANMPWMSSNALSPIHFFYSSMMAFFNYSTCLLKNRSNHKSRSPEKGSIYSMSLLIGGKSSVESEIPMLIHIFIELAEYFYITCCDKKSASSRHPSTPPNSFPGWGNAKSWTEIQKLQ